MDIQLQKCNGCGRLNESREEGWTRILGVTNKNSPQPTAHMKLDYCPACSASTTVDKLVAASQEVFQQNRPKPAMVVPAKPAMVVPPPQPPT